MHSVSICDTLVQLTKYLSAWVFLWYLPLVAAVILLIQMFTSAHLLFPNKLKRHYKRDIFYNVCALQWLFIKLDDNITV